MKDKRMDDRDQRDAWRRPALSVGLAGYLLMLGIGSMYGLSALQVEMPRLLGVSHAAAVMLFGAASFGLAFGSSIGARVLDAAGPRLAAGAGTTLWGAATMMMGLCIATSSFPGVLGSAAVGGIGVGVAYLTLVSTVAPAFPATPLVGSAIGPLGFASGTATFVAIASVVGYPTHGLQEVAAATFWIGCAIAAVAVVACFGLPRRRPQRGLLRRDEAQAVPPAFSMLLFVNALPGMLVFAVAVNLVLDQGAGPDEAHVLLALSTIALFFGGLSAPSLRNAIGARQTFTALLVLRGIALIGATLASGLPEALIMLTVVLFGHGVGFSMLPALVRAQDRPDRFTHNYGHVLIAWGVAGVVATGMAGASLAVTGSLTLALGAAGVIVLVGAAWLAAAPRGDTQPFIP